MTNEKIREIAELAMATDTSKETLERLREMGCTEEEIGVFNYFCFWYGSAGSCIERSVKAGNVKTIFC